MDINLVGPSYNLDSKPAGVQRTVNLVPVPQEAGNERAPWVMQDVPGLTEVNIGALVLAGWIDLFEFPNKLNATPTNSGTETIDSDPELIYAGITDYVSGTVVWTLSFSASVAGTEPTLTTAGLVAGRVGVSIVQPTTGAQGVGSLFARVDGGPKTNTLHFTVTETQITWSGM